MPLPLHDHPAAVFEFWDCEKSGEAEKDEKSRLWDASEPHVVIGRRCDGGGVCKAERAAWCEM